MVNENFEVYSGPMASGKTRAAIQRAKELEALGLSVACLKPEFELRDNGLNSRNGLQRSAISVQSLGRAATLKEVELADVVVIDELFFFNGELMENTVGTIGYWLSTGKRLVAATLDYSAMGELMSVYERIIDEHHPLIIECLEAECRNHDEPVRASRTQIIEQATGVAVREGLPELVPEDPNNPIYEYRPVCLDCFTV